MSLAALVSVLGAKIIGVVSDPFDCPDCSLASLPAVSAESQIDALPAASRARRASPDYPNSLHYEAMPAPDMVLRLGNRRAGPELEIGAFGGGRARAAGFVHVVVGFDF